MNPYLSCSASEREEMLRAAGAKSIEELLAQIPAALRWTRETQGEWPDWAGALTELELAGESARRSRQNAGQASALSFLGAGIYRHFIPSVVSHLASRPEFVTAYTPYQAEASQGMLQAIFEYQTMIARLTGLEVSNAGLYDGATALAEGVLMALNLQPGRKRVVVSKGVNPQYRQVVRTHLRTLDVEYIEVELHEGATCAALWRKALGAAVDSASALEDSASVAKSKGLCAAAVFQSPNFFGCLEDGAELTAQAHAAGALAIQVFNPISLGLLAPPGQWGVDIAAGEGQPLGMPPSAGGETLGLFAARMNHIWKMPGRLAGLTRDRFGRRSYVLTLQSREQHIRRARATSNICTNQSLYALTALIYLAALGAEGLRELAEICARRCALAREKLAALPGFGLEFPQTPVFHEFVLRTPRPAEDLFKQLHDRSGILPGFPLSREFPEMKNALLVCATEMTSAADIDRLAGALAEAAT